MNTKTVNTIMSVLIITVSCNSQAAPDAKTKVNDVFFENQRLKMQKINNLKHDLSVLKQQEEIARTRVLLNKSLVELEVNNDTLPSANIRTVSAQNQNTAFDSDYSNALKKFNTLEIDAVINNRVIFKKIEQGFTVGDEIYKHVEIELITGSTVVFKLPNNIKKTLTLDWVD